MIEELMAAFMMLAVAKGFAETLSSAVLPQELPQLGRRRHWIYGVYLLGKYMEKLKSRMEAGDWEGAKEVLEDIRRSVRAQGWDSKLEKKIEELADWLEKKDILHASAAYAGIEAILMDYLL